MLSPRIIIVGAGPTGLGSALRLTELRIDNFLVLDASDRCGGLADSHTDTQGFTWDFGGHVVFSHYKYFDDVLAKVGPEMNSLTRRAVVFMSAPDDSDAPAPPSVVAYPVQNHVHQMPKALRWPCVKGLIDAYTKHIKGQEDPSSPPHFAEWCRLTMGDGLTDYFMRPYNEKLWAWPLESLSSTWLGERVAVPNLDKALYNLVDGAEDKPWGPNAQFAYPVQGGTGALWNSVARYIPKSRIRTNSKVMAIDTDRKIVTLSDGSTEGYDILISTIPLPTLTSIISPPRERLSQLTAQLKHCSVTVVGLGIKGPEPEVLSRFHWSYYSDSAVPFFRCTALNHYSQHICPKGEYYSLLFECSSSPWRMENKAASDAEQFERIEEAALKLGLILDRSLIVSRWLNFREFGYPTPTTDRDEILNEVLPTLENDLSIFSRGRFGAWRYEVGNMDHSMMQGVEVIDKLLQDSPFIDINEYFVTEPTLNRPSYVNGRKDTTRFDLDLDDDDDDLRTTAPQSPL